jgi:broad specificity phosphatase PhoE
MCVTYHQVDHHHYHHCTTLKSKVIHKRFLRSNKRHCNTIIGTSTSTSSSSSVVILLSLLLNHIYVSLVVLLLISVPNHNIAPFTTSSYSLIDAFQISNLRQSPSSQVILKRGWTIQQQKYRQISLASSSSTTTTTSTISNTTTTTNNNNMNVTSLPLVSKTTKRIFWIRHGEVINPGQSYNKSVYYGSMDVPLSIHGQQEAIAAGQCLSQYTFSNIYSSNLSRAIYGAEQILLLQNKNQATDVEIVAHDVIQVPDFMELNRGDWCGKTIDEIGKDLMEQFNQCNETVTPNNGESYRTFNDRVLHGRDTIVLQQLQYGQSCAVVSHLQVTRCIVGDALHIPMHEIYKIPISTASITCIDYIYDDPNNNKKNSIDDNNNISKPIQQIVHFQSYKPEIGKRDSIDNAN